MCHRRPKSAIVRPPRVKKNHKLEVDHPPEEQWKRRRSSDFLLATVDARPVTTVQSPPLRCQWARGFRRAGVHTVRTRISTSTTSMTPGATGTVPGYQVPRAPAGTGSLKCLALNLKVRSLAGQVRFITRPKSGTMRAKRKKRSRANRTKVPKLE